MALIHRRDAAHKTAVEFSRTLTSTLFTTDDVLTEVLAFCSSEAGLRKDAARAVRQILAARSVIVVPQSREGLLNGLGLYEARPDKGYSLADCISTQVMRKEALRDVLTNDRHFEQKASERFSG